MAESLKVVLGADDAQFQEAIKRAISSVDGLAGRTLAFGTAANTTTGSLDKLKGPLREFATSSLRVQGGFGALAEQLLTAFGAGGAVVAGLGAGVLALSYVWKGYTAAADGVKKINEELARSFTALANSELVVGDPVNAATRSLREQQGANGARQAQLRRDRTAAERIASGRSSGVPLSQTLAFMGRTGMTTGTQADAASAVSRLTAEIDKLQEQSRQYEAAVARVASEAGKAVGTTRKGRAAGVLAPSDFAVNLSSLLAQSSDGSNLEDNAATIDGFFDSTVSALAEEGASAAADLSASLRTSFGDGIAGALVDGVGNGFAALFSSGSFGAGFVQLTRSLLSGLGSAMVAFGKQSLIASTLMVKIKAALSSFLPGGAVVASIAMIAAGSLISSLNGSAQSAFGGGGSSSFSGSSASVASSVQQQGSVTVVWPKDAFANPSDPTFQDFFAETIRQLGATRQLTIVTA